MHAVDTNVVIRFLVRDDEAQSARAWHALTSGAAFISLTVILETEWVLRSVYRFPRPTLARGLRQLMSLPGVDLEAPDRVAVALDWMEDGMDFADALHLARSQHCEVFLTFDRTLIQAAADADSIPVAEPPPAA